MPAEAMGGGFAQGKNMLWRRDVMEAGGGIRALGAEIAEDAASTKLVRGQGTIVNLVDSPFEQPLGRSRAAATSGCGRCAGRGCGARPFRCSTRPRFSPAPRCPASRGLCRLRDGLEHRRRRARRRARLVSSPKRCSRAAVRWHFSWRMPLMFLLRDLMLPVIYIDAWFVDDFVWRGNEMSVREEEPSVEQG